MQKQISSSWTPFMKRVFPALWFGFLGVFAASAFTAERVPGSRLPFVLVPAIMAVVGFFLMKALLWDLADRVHDDGDALLVRKGGLEQRIPLADILDVGCTTLVNPTRITLLLGGPSAAGPFGSRVVFSPEREFSFNPFREPGIVEDLVRRIHQARSRPANP